MEATINPLIPSEEVYRDTYCQVNLMDTYFAVYQYYDQLPQSRERLLPSMKVVLDQARRWTEQGVPVFYWLEINEGEFLPSEDVTWVRKDAIPQLVDAGIRYLAYVSKNNLFRHFSQETLLDSEQGRTLSLRIFQENQDAQVWLKQLRNES